MPSRLLREGILDSEAVNSLSFAAEVFYRRLMSVVDDFGRFDGRPTVLRSRLYPLKIESVSEADIVAWADECARAGLIARYTVGGKPFILFEKLGSPRAKVSKFPEPPARPEIGPVQHTDVNVCAQTQTDANGRAQAFACAPYSYSGAGSSSGASAGSAADAGTHGGTGPGGTQGIGPTPEDARDLWNRQAGLQPCQSVSVHRERVIRHWATGNPDWVRHWRAVIEFMGRTGFYTGDNPQKWRATFSWLFEKDNFSKVLDRMLAPAPAGASRPGDDFAQKFLASRKPGTEAA